MKISIITPTYNSISKITRNIESVLEQNYEQIEHLIIDNLSQDGTISKINEYSDQYFPKKLKIISEKDSGISDAFNKGITNASGDIIGILNSDDEYYHNNVISEVASAFLDPNIDFVHGDMYFVDTRFGTNIRRPLLCPLTYAMPYNHPTFFVRKKIYDEIGLFDLSYRYTMDFELICRMYETTSNSRYKGFYINKQPMVTMHAGGVSWENELKTLDELERALKKYNFWNNDAAKALKHRAFRIKLKNKLDQLKIGSFVKLWRMIKWKN